MEFCNRIHEAAYIAIILLEAQLQVSLRLRIASDI